MTGTPAPSTFDTQRRLIGLRVGRYVLGPRLGAGGTASVYLAREIVPGGGGRLVGLKVIHDHLLEEADFVRMFVDEASLAKRMSHPNVVQVYESGQEGQSLFLAMEYLHGQPLSRLFERLAERNQRLPFDLVMWIGARVADGLHHAHGLRGDDGRPLGVIHRDVSPQNVFVSYDGQVKLIDFGIAKAEGRLAKTTLGRIKGKFAYMAPEQVLGNDFDQRADLFALGATLYELTVGVRLFAGDDQTDTLQKLLFEKIPDPAEQAPDVPSELSAIIRKALETEPHDRYGKASHMARELDTVLATRGVTHGQAALAKLMSTCFADEMQERAKDIAELRTTRTPEEIAGRASLVRIADDVGTPDGMTATPPSVAPAPDKVRKLWWAAGAVAVVAALVGAVAVVGYASDDPPEPAPVTASVPKTVTFDIQVQPPVEATITVQGQRVDERPPRVELPKGEEPVWVEVEADGYERARIEARPNRDQLVVVPLMKKAPPVASSAPADSSNPGAGGSAGRRAGPPKQGPTGPNKPPPKSTGTGSLVTEYPF
ncbi:MAG: protein kinase domain-containing protein [Myxococcota bacterium]